MKDDLKHAGLFQRLCHKEKDQGVHRPLDQVLDGAGRQDCQESFSVQKCQPVGSEDDVAENDYHELCCEDPRQGKVLFIEE